MGKCIANTLSMQTMLQERMVGCTNKFNGQKVPLLFITPVTVYGHLSVTFFI
jgi:hypothetical protein